MNELRIASLAEVSLECLHGAFAEAFADYLVPLRLDAAGLGAMLRRRGYEPALSAMACEDERIVGFHLIGRGEWRGAVSAYDCASGVMPDRRGQGLSGRLFDWLRPRWREAGIEQCVLEVIERNEAARRSYQSVGFEPVREFECLQLNLPLSAELPADILPAGRDDNRWPDEYLHWFDWLPSWQNSPQSLLRSPQRFRRIRLLNGATPVAIGMVSPGSGEVPLFAVHPCYRRQGLGRALIGALRAASHQPLRFINVEAGSPAVAFLGALGAEFQLRQLELVWRLDRPSISQP
ncbi:GNAT family N-acetyltransferase [Chitinimonas koreensis]|uniref:GNAT family N-acetyltransferase n=1 Tax=Chitinimonas koreensis TaxID=356302 RepID=UPI00048E82B5|nr:GNAT family N-acetyltransferase [Chitinimonas koreensis]QNM96685.1 GNAT family N-acetyltransferase [Chitinimonas koreensis]